MYAAAAPPSRGGKAALPVAAICCLGLLAFLVAATIVLALIPIYLPNKGNSLGITAVTTTTTAVGVVTTTTTRGATTTTTAVTSTNTRTLFVQFAGTPQPNTGANNIAGTGVNLAAVAQVLGIAPNAQINLIQTQPTTTRRKRGVITRRRRQALVTNVLIQVQVANTSNCTTDACINSTLNTTQTQLNKNFNGVTIVVNANGVNTSITYNLVFVAVTDSKPSGFGGVASSQTFTASQTGLFNNPATWSEGIVPYGNCAIVIPVGITVSIASDELQIQVSSIDVAGTLVLNSNGNGTGFEFVYPVIITVEATGTILDLTTTKTIFIPQPALIVGLSGSNAVNGSTIVQTPASRKKRAAGDRVGVTSTADGSTVAITEAIIKSYQRVTSVCVQSGAITDTNTFLAGFALSDLLCPIGCGIDVPFGAFTLALGSTTLKISKLEISEQCTLSFGTLSVTTYTFATIIDIEVRGTLKYDGAGIVNIRAGSSVNLFSTSTFVAQQVTMIQVININGGVIGTPLQIAPNHKGAFFLKTTLDGTISFSTAAPGANDTAPPFVNGTNTTTVGSNGTTTTTVSNGTTTTTASNVTGTTIALNRTSTTTASNRTTTTATGNVTTTTTSSTTTTTASTSTTTTSTTTTTTTTSGTTTTTTTTRATTGGTSTTTAASVGTTTTTVASTGLVG